MNAPTRGAVATPSPVAAILRHRSGEGLASDLDTLAEESPLEIRYGDAESERVVTMRTPGADTLLAVGLLLDMGLLDGPDDLLAVRQEGANRIRVRLRTHRAPPPMRKTAVTSACGVCGDSRLELDRLLASPPLGEGPEVPVARILELPERLRAAQAMFSRSGGLHAAALFTLDGRLLRLEEDVGRHNAVDKVIGWACLERRLPLQRQLLMVSGRTSYEIVKKCIRARLPLLAAVSAPSSLAVELADASGMTLIGFLRPPRFNVYAGEARLRG